ncbi:MAG: Zn-ribbon domain-containing OB-fold protein [Candidatus Marinimicrobia bacterium]|nr:Zn-ribbon domain-containing OB-fold protein [Candidatus Neomarinimicrobiota bacterium]
MTTPAKYWREIPQRYRLEAGKCKKCGKVFFPPRLICDACGSREFESVNLGREGTLITYTIIRVPPGQFSDQAPYAVGIVELDGGVRITTQVVDCDFDEIKIGKKVKVEFRKISSEGEAGIICYGYKCVPIR